jgi:hypothetical protein
MSRPRDHIIYLLSLWQAQTKRGPTWRAWLARPSTGERRGFATLDELFDYLKTSVSRPECQSDAGPEQVPLAGESTGPGSPDEPPIDQAPDCRTRPSPALRRDESSDQSQAKHITSGGVCHE